MGAPKNRNVQKKRNTPRDDGLSEEGDGRIEVAPGVRIPGPIDGKGPVVRYRILRCHPDAPHKPAGMCALPDRGVRKDLFDLATEPPSVEAVLAIWGSGVYRFQWFREGGAAAGTSSHFAFDDPDHPQLPLYRGPAPTQAAPAAPTPAGGSPLDALSALSKDGYVPMAAVALLMQSMQAQVTSQAMLFEQHRTLDRERRRQDDADAQERLRSQAAWYEHQQKQTSVFWAEQSKLVAQVRQQTQAPAVDSDLAERFEELQETIEKTSQAQLGFWEGMIKEIAPALVSKLMGPGAPAPATPNGAA